MHPSRSRRHRRPLLRVKAEFETTQERKVKPNGDKLRDIEPASLKSRGVRVTVNLHLTAKNRLECERKGIWQPANCPSSSVDSKIRWPRQLFINVHVKQVTHQSTSTTTNTSREYEWGANRTIDGQDLSGNSQWVNKLGRVIACGSLALHVITNPTQRMRRRVNAMSSREKAWKVRITYR